MLGDSRKLEESRAERINELECEIETKVAGLEVEESEADLVVQQWQESYEALSAEEAELDEKLETLPLEHHHTFVSDRDHYRSQIGPLQLKVQVLEVKNAELENNASRLAILESKLQSKEEEISRLSQDDNEAVLSWQERNRVLEDELTAARSRMDNMPMHWKKPGIRRRRTGPRLLNLRKL